MTENKIERLEQLIIARLRLVIDPETRADVIRMRLIENLTVNEEGQENILSGRPPRFVQLRYH